MAHRTFVEGPTSLNEAEALDLRWNLTVLLQDLAYVPDDDVPALSAPCHTQLSRAAIDSIRGWHGERKTLRRALTKVAPHLVKSLDDGLIAACNGDRYPLLEIGQQILLDLVGNQCTYLERYN